MKTGFIALRYLLSKKSNNAVNYISKISVLGFAVGSFALIVILSTLNGFENVILSMYSDFDADFKIESVNGKTFEEKESLLKSIEKTPGLQFYHTILEDQAVVKHYDFQTACYIKGVSSSYFIDTKIDKYVQIGYPDLDFNMRPRAILGAGIDYKLQTSVENPHSLLHVYVPKRGNYSISDPNMIQTLNIQPGGVLYLDDQINQKYVFVPISFARELFERENEISYIEIRVNSQNIENAEEYLLKKFKSSKYSVKNRLQQQENLYKMFESEKWVTFALLTFVLLLASFNVTGTLSMLVLEKQKDIFTLTTLGANASFIRKIFIKEGILISLFGGSIGLFFGIILVLLQDKFGFIKMTGSIIDSYPVKLHWNDALLVLFTSLLLGLLTSFYPAWKAYRKK